jgi:DNA-binding transcriptional LysR family regulator
VRHTDTVLAQLAAAEIELRALAGLETGALRMASFTSSWSALLPEAISTFRERFPDVGLETQQAEPSEAIKLLREGKIDLAIVFEPNDADLREGDAVEALPLLDDPLYVVLPKGHLLALRKRLSLGDLADHPWVIPTAACGELVRAACHAAGFQPRVVFETGDYMAIQGFVAAGVGVALIPALALSPVRDDVAISSLGSRAPRRRIVALVPHDAYRTSAASAMIEILRSMSPVFEQNRLIDAEWRSAQSRIRAVS